MTVVDFYLTIVGLSHCENNRRIVRSLIERKWNNYDIVSYLRCKHE